MQKVENTEILKSVTKLTFWLYVLVVLISGFGSGSYEIPAYIPGAVVELVAFWVVPCLAFVVYLTRRPTIRVMLWKEWRLMIIGAGTILLVEVIHKTVLITFGVMLPEDKFVLFPYQQSNERQLFVALAVAAFVLKYLGLILCLVSLVRKTSRERIRSDKRLSILLFAVVICVTLMIGGEVKSILEYFN
jgi:hypothetical protein